MLGLAGVTEMETSVAPGAGPEELVPPPPPPHPPNRSKITQREIILANNHLSLRLFILLPPFNCPSENGIMDSRIHNLLPLPL